MKITDIKLRQLTGVMETSGGPYMEDRLVQPTDVYEEFRVNSRRAGRKGGRQIDDTHMETTAIYAQIDTDEGISGPSDVRWYRTTCAGLDRQRASQSRSLLQGD